MNNGQPPQLSIVPEGGDENHTAQTQYPGQTTTAATFMLPSIPMMIGGLRVDPFRSYPILFRSFLPYLVDHYLVSMAVDIPELDQPGNRGLLRTRWFPLVMTEPSLFLPIAEISEKEYDEMFAINSKAAFFILKEAAKYVSDGGKIISVVTALLGAFTGFYTSYAGSKAPVEHFTRGVCKELQPRRISVNNVAPGPMDTPFFYPQESAEAVEFHKSNGLGGRLTEVTDIAPIIRFLCTEGGWITGQTLFANGGYTTR